MCSICLHYCKYYHPWSLRRSQILSKCQHDNHKPTVNEVEEEKNESTDLEEEATEEGEQDNKLFKRLRIWSSRMMMVW